VIYSFLSAIASSAPVPTETGDITISPVWAGVIMGLMGNIILGTLWIARQLFPSKADLQTARDECRERHEENRASIEAAEKFIRAEFTGQIAESNRAMMAEFGKLASKVEKLLIRTAILKDRSSHDDSRSDFEDETRFPV
jgi:nucleoside permease NupC